MTTEIPAPFLPIKAWWFRGIGWRWETQTPSGDLIDSGWLHGVRKSAPDHAVITAAAKAAARSARRAALAAERAGKLAREMTETATTRSTT